MEELTEHITIVSPTVVDLGGELLPCWDAKFVEVDDGSMAFTAEFLSEDRPMYFVEIGFLSNEPNWYILFDCPTGWGDDSTADDFIPDGWWFRTENNMRGAGMEQTLGEAIADFVAHFKSFTQKGDK